MKISGGVHSDIQSDQIREPQWPHGDGLIEILSDQFEPGVDGAEVYVIQHGVDAGQGAHVCDPVSHGTRSEDRYTLKVYSQSGLRS
jgi:hypothetical protein